MVLSAGWYLVHGRNHYYGPPDSAAVDTSDGERNREDAKEESKEAG